MAKPIKTASTVSAAALAAALTLDMSHASPVQDPGAPARAVRADPISPAARDIILAQAQAVKKMGAGRMQGDPFADTDSKGFKDKGGFADFRGSKAMKTDRTNPAVNVKKSLKTY